MPFSQESTEVSVLQYIEDLLWGVETYELCQEAQEVSGIAPGKGVLGFKEKGSDYM